MVLVVNEGPRSLDDGCWGVERGSKSLGVGGAERARRAW